MSLLSVRDVSKRFGGLQALKNVSFEVEADSIHGLMGANGAGKTTLFSIVAGNQRPTAGDVVFDGASLVGLRPDRICRLGVARTFQIVRPFPTMTVRENVEIGQMFGNTAAGADRVDTLLEETGLGPEADRPAGALTLSGRKRLEVARALATGPRVLMLDEIMGGLNPTEVNATLDLIGALNAEGLTILVIEHNMSAIMRIAETVLVLEGGRLIAAAPPAEVTRDARVIAVYLGEPVEEG